MTWLALGLALAGCIAPPAVTEREHTLADEQLGLSATPAPMPADNWW